MGAAALASLVAFGAACVDLFHGTDFDTLCVTSPTDPQCAADASHEVDVGTDAAPDARRPHPNFCQWTSAEARAQALRACAWLGACEGPLGEGAFGPCAVRAQLAYDCSANPSLRPAGDADELWSCLATVSSCSQVDRCVFPAGIEPCPRQGSGSFTACGSANPAVRVRCASTTTRSAGIEPCAMLGKTCAKEDESAASCSGEARYACTTSECSGTAAIDCTPVAARTFDRGVDCAMVGGGKCIANEGGLAPSCAGTRQTACSTASAPACEGTVIAACFAGSEVRIDCARIGLLCDDAKEVPPYDLGAACVRRSGQDLCTAADSCDGPSVRSCGRGALYELDCMTVGLGACAMTDGHAACTPR